MSLRLCPRFSVATVALLVLAPPLRVVAAERIELANGATIVSVPSDEPLAVAISIGVGSADDPAGQEGLAELTARCLTAASQAHRAGGDLVYRLASTVGGAELEVSAHSTTFLLSDVHDLPAALTLLTEALAHPTFPIPDILAARRSLLTEAVEDLAGMGPARRVEALSALTGSPSTWDRTWALAALAPEDVRAFHATHYGPAALRIAVVGTGAPVLVPTSQAAPLTDLPGTLAGSIGTWTSQATPSVVIPGVTATGQQQRLLSAAGESGVTLAFPAHDASSFIALLAAADACGKGSWVITGAGRTAVGALASARGSLMFAECASAAPAIAAKDFLSQLAKVAKRPLAAAAWARATDPARHALPVGERGAACLDLHESGREPGTDCGPASLLGAVDPKAVSLAAGALASGPMVVVGTTADAAAAKAWMAAFPQSASRRADEPAAATGRERVAEAKAWIASAVTAHGGPALLSLSGWTRLSDDSAMMDEQPKLLGTLRVDTCIEPTSIRHEFRAAARQLGGRTVRVKDWVIERVDGAGTLAGTEATAVRNQLLRQPILLLRRAASGQLPIRSEGLETSDGRRLRQVSLADPDTGLTRLTFDDKTGQLLSAAFRQRIRASAAPRDVTMTWSDLRVVDGVLVPFRETSRAGESGMAQVSVAKAWTLHRDAFDPGKISTSPDDLAVERIAE